MFLVNGITQGRRMKMVFLKLSFGGVVQVADD
jgi:hypothetical protein